MHQEKKELVFYFYPFLALKFKLFLAAMIALAEPVAAYRESRKVTNFHLVLNNSSLSIPVCTKFAQRYKMYLAFCDIENNMRYSDNSLAAI